MSEELQKFGLYIDDLYSLRVLNPDVASETSQLKEEAENFTEKLEEFKMIAKGFIDIAETLSKQVEREKLRALALQNLANTMEKQREVEQQLLQNQVIEKMIDLDRVKIELQYLQRIEAEQQEMLESFHRNQ